VACRNLDEKEWKTEAWRGGRGLANVAFETNAPTIIRNAQTDPRVRDPEFYRKHKLISYLAIPLIAKEKTLGVIGFYTKQEHDFSNDEIEFLSTLAEQGAIAIQNAQLHEGTKRSLDQVRALHEIDKAITSTLDLGAVLNVLLEKVELFLPIAAATTVRLLNPQTGDLESLACRGLDEKEWKAQQQRMFGGRARGVIETKAAVTVRNIQADPQTYNPAIFQSHGLVSYLGVPLIAKDEPLGVLSLYTHQEHDFTQEEIAFLDTLGHQAALAIHNARLYQEATVREKNLLAAHEQLDALHTITAIASQSLDLKTVTQSVIQKITEIFDFDVTRIHLYNARRDELLLSAHFSKEPERFRPVGSFPRGQGIAGRVAESGEPLIFEDLTMEPLYESMSRSGIPEVKGRRFFAALPIKSKHLVLGTMVCIGFAPRRLSAKESQLLTSMAGQIAVAVENARLFEETCQRADELTQKTFDLEKANRTKDEFLAMISHELRTPLNVIMGYTGLLRESMFGALNPQQDDALKKVVIQSNDLLSIVSNLLRATQIGSGEIKAERARTDLGQLLDEIKNAYDLPATNELTLNWDFPSDLPTVETDSEKLRHILVNLIHNAIKFTEQGSVTVAARHLPKCKTLRFTVADTGPGIPKESLSIIFDMFHQVDSSNTRAHGGLGLGLYIVKKYTELLGGKIEVKSDLGEGSNFTVTIPCETARYTTGRDDLLEQTL
jgi:signal transduction histidine kinase/putative methionine-R-sulfoxide reductase with GAF domain